VDLHVDYEFYIQIGRYIIIITRKPS